MVLLVVEHIIEEGMDREAVEKMQAIAFVRNASSLLLDFMLRSLIFSLEAPRPGYWCLGKGGRSFHLVSWGYNESVVAMNTGVLA